MGLRHTAALALLDWYLMMPTSYDEAQLRVDMKLPLSKWNVYSASIPLTSARPSVYPGGWTPAELGWLMEGFRVSAISSPTRAAIRRP